MTRAELEHILRAAVAITGRREWVIVGSLRLTSATILARGSDHASLDGGSPW